MVSERFGEAGRRCPVQFRGLDMRKLLITVISAGVMCSPVDVGAWGLTAHRAISRAAVRALPSDFPPFLARQIDWIGERSITPDSWRSASEPFSKIEEDPNHGWFMEQFAFMHPIPRSRYEFVVGLHNEYLRVLPTDPARASLTNVRWTGTLPYAAVETYERLKVAFRSWRELQRTGADPTFIELDAAFYTGWLSHYIADGAMPLHTSIHHDGWQGANPRGYTTDPSIHSRFETTFVDRMALSESDIIPRVAQVRRLDDPFAAILAHLDRSHTRVERVYQLDRSDAYADAHNDEARTLVLSCTTDAATLLRDLIYSAWVTSGTPVVQAPGTLQPMNPRHPHNARRLTWLGRASS